MLSSGMEILWILATLIPLGLGGYFDYTKRLIPDKVWLFQFTLALLFLIIFFQLEPTRFEVIMVVVNILVGFLFMLILIFTRIMAGGDIKGFFVISISYPQLITVFQVPLFSFPEIFPSLFGIFLNFFLLYVLLAIGLFVVNFIDLVRYRTFDGIAGSLSSQIQLLFEGRRVSVQSLKYRKFFNPAEIYLAGTWRLHTPKYDGLMTDEEFEELEEKEILAMHQGIKQSDKQYIWIRPQFPGISILFVAYCMTILIGVPLGEVFSSLTSLL